MISTLNRIFLPSIFDTSLPEDVLSLLASKTNLSFEESIIKFIASGAVLNDQLVNNSQLAPVGLNTEKFIQFMNLLNSDLKNLYTENAGNWDFSFEEELILDHFYKEALKLHAFGFSFSSKIEESIAVYAPSYISTDEILLRTFPQTAELLRLINARFMSTLELNSNIHSIAILGNFNYSVCTVSLVTISLLGGELFHNTDMYNMVSNSFDLTHSYLTLKGCIFNNIGTLFSLISNYGLNSFLSLNVNELPSLSAILQSAGPGNLSTYLLGSFEKVRLPFYLGYVFLPIVKGFLGISASINPHLGHFSAHIVTHITFYSVSLVIPVFKVMKISSISCQLEQLATLVNPQDVLGYSIPLKKVIFMAYSLVLIGGVVAQKMGY